MHLDPREARTALGLDPDGTYVALLPGSRHGEVARLGPDFAATVAWLQQQRPGLNSSLRSPTRARQTLAAALDAAGVRDRVTLRRWQRAA